MHEPLCQHKTMVVINKLHYIMHTGPMNEHTRGSDSLLRGRTFSLPDHTHFRCRNNPQQVHMFTLHAYVPVTPHTVLKPAVYSTNSFI
jgi:hypothetical protein